jgi:hypothetical protein
MGYFDNTGRFLALLWKWEIGTFYGRFWERFPGNGGWFGLGLRVEEGIRRETIPGFTEGHKKRQKFIFQISGIFAKWRPLYYHVSKKKSDKKRVMRDKNH